MRNLLYFRNVRRDGGIRLGVELDGERLFHQFIDGPKVNGIWDENPAIDWYIDILFEGKNILGEPEKVRKWLVQIKPFLQKGLAELAQNLLAGVDEDALPLTHTVSHSPPGLQIAFKIMAIRKIRHEDVAKEILHLGKTWEKEMKKIPAAEPDLI